MEMPTCKVKGEMRSTLGGVSSGGVAISPGVSKRRQQGGGEEGKRWRGEMQKGSSSDANVLEAGLFNSLPDAV